MLTVDVDVLPQAKFSTSVLPEEIANLIRYALKACGGDGVWSVAVVLTTDDHLRELHRQYMGVDEETDVMTFPHGAGLDPADQGGDIVISVERAAAQGPEHGLTTLDEVRFLAVHGVLHLCGWSDESPEQRQRMLRRQTEIIAAFDAAAPSADA